MIQRVALGIAACDADHKVREEGGNNRGPRIFDYLRGTDPPINVAAPWCAAAVQYWSDLAARTLGTDNPLDAVKLEAYVQSYHDWAEERGALVDATQARPGDLVLFDFHGNRWDHIGLLAQLPDGDGAFWTVEGNTNEAGSREGDGVLFKPRKLGDYPVSFVRWGS